MVGCSSHGRGLAIFLLATASRPALGPIHPPIQWVPGALSLGVKRPRREADHPTHLHLVPRSRMHGTIPPLPNTPSRRGAQFKKSTGTTLPYLYIMRWAGHVTCKGKKKRTKIYRETSRKETLGRSSRKCISEK
jgi:hypothetical protein